MKDKFGREINYLRLSVTDLCNLKCTYCMGECGVEKLQHSDVLSIEQLFNVAAAARELGFAKLRITGGEPLVRKGILSLFEKIATLGFETLAITTNGALLTQYAKPLFDFGVNSINISIDSLNKQTYSDITRGGNLSLVLDGIDAVIDAGFKNVKLNTVLIGDVNDNEVKDIIRFAHSKNMLPRFIELMPIGDCVNYNANHFVSYQKVLNSFQNVSELPTHTAVAKHFLVDGYEAGFIPALSAPFCSGCNRIRISATGELIPCLHSNECYPLKDVADNITDLKTAIENGILNKQENHHLSEKITQKSGMFCIGG